MASLNGTHWVALGIIGLLIGSFSFMEVVDTTKPDILWFYESEHGPVILDGAMHPQGGKNYTEVTYIYVLVRDIQSGISRVQWNAWQTEQSSTQHLLQYAGFCYYHRTPTADEWTWFWGDPFPTDQGPFGGIIYLWQIWGLNLSSGQEISAEGHYSFGFQVYNGAGAVSEPTGMPNKFNIVPSGSDGEEEPGPPENGQDFGDSDQLPTDSGSDTYTPPITYTGTDYMTLPLAFFGLGAVAIVYGFSKQKKKGPMK